MHIPPNEIEQVAQKLLKMAQKYIVLIEWTQPIGDVVPAEWNWIHDYRALFGDRENRTGAYPRSAVIFLIRP